MALSSTAASADSGTANNHSIVNGVDSAITHVVEAAPAIVSQAVSAPAHTAHQPAVPPAAVPAPAVVVSKLPPAVDHLVANAPVLNKVVPGGAVSSVTAPVVEPAGTLLQGVTGPAIEAVTPLVDSLPKLPDAIPETQVTVPGVGAPRVSQPVGLPAEAGDHSPVTAVPVDTTPPAGESAVTPPMMGFAGRVGPSGFLGAQWPASAPVSSFGEASAPLAPSDGKYPDGDPGGVAGNSSAVITGNSSGAAAAWLPNMSLFHPLAAILESTAASYHLPAPVSFDPGSSPD
ncbi:hypothetical protein [Arthrobacter sp. NyZ413]|uniref:hypothetical protein n=1 Tax=Arthrobacter sp. NyZ413 TaxID=3144669 RepID=UPI003BF84449